MNILDVALAGKIAASGGGGGGTDDYNDLLHLPQINGVTLSGDKTPESLGLQGELTFDTEPTEDSTNPVESGGVFTALTSKQDTISDLETIRSGAAAGGTAVQPSSLETALAEKQDTLDQTQLAAVNSGINSTKVEQISTNQTNILYGIKNGAIINLFDIRKAINVGAPRCRYSLINDAITIESYDVWANATFRCGKLKAGWYTFVITVTNYNVESATVKFGKSINSFTDITGNGTFTYVANMQEDEYCDLCLYINYSATSYNNSMTVSNIAVIPNEYYNCGFDEYVDPMLSNTLLTNGVSLLDKFNGAKNYCDYNFITTNQVLNGDSITVTGKEAYSRCTMILSLPKAEDYVVSFNIDAVSGETNLLRLKLVNRTTNMDIYSREMSAIGKRVYMFTISQSDLEDGILLMLFTNDSSTTLSVANSITVSELMVIDKEAWDNGLTQYVPFAASNYDLTAREAEDRAALAEVVDNGAKNVLSWSLEEAKRINTDGTWSGNVYTHNGITYTVNSDMTISISMVSGTTTHSRSVFKLSKSVPNSYTNSYVLSSGNTCMSAASFALYAEETDSPWTDIAIDYGTGIIISSTAQSVYSVYIAVKADYVLSITHTVKPMICTLADWKVSQKYSPHRPSYDLVAAFAQNGGFIDSSLGSVIANADLNSINKTTFAVYNEPANLPSGITGYCYVRTSVFDENSALQELYVIQPNPVSFFRIKLNNAWTVWVQTSNV